MHGIITCKGTGFSCHPPTQHTHTCMCVCVWHNVCVCVAHFVINVGFRGGWQWRCVSLTACLQPGAERHHPDRRIFPGAECYHTFTLVVVVVSNIYTKYTMGIWDITEIA